MIPATMTDLRTGKVTEITYTPYAEMKEGEEFIRLNLWVNISGLQGERIGNQFRFGKRQYDIHRFCENRHGILDLHDMADMEEEQRQIDCGCDPDGYDDGEGHDMKCVGETPDMYPLLNYKCTRCGFTDEY